MKSAPFALAVPASVDEAVSCLAEHGTDARVLAGGQSLVPLMASRALSPTVLVDLDRVPGLDTIAARTDGTVAVGAMVRQRAVERSALIAEHVPALSLAVPFIAHATVRNQGTIGGSIANADPAAEIPNVVTLLGAVAIVVGPRGERMIPAAELFVGPLMTSIGADEVLVEIRFPIRTAGEGVGFAEVSRRPGDPALVAVGARVRLDVGGRITDARVSLSGVAPTPVRSSDAEAVLVGERSGADVFAAAATAALTGLEPADDLQGTAAYRRHLVRVLVRRALTDAMGSAR